MKVDVKISENTVVDQNGLINSNDEPEVPSLADLMTGQVPTVEQNEDQEIPEKTGAGFQWAIIIHDQGMVEY